MAKFDKEKFRNTLQSFDFQKLFIEELGWANCTLSKSAGRAKEIIFTKQPIAELSGAVVFEITVEDGSIPEAKQRELIAKEVRKLHHENILIFINQDRSQCIWNWQKKQNGKFISRDHLFTYGQSGDAFISKIGSLFFDISEFEEDGNVSIADVANRIKKALDVEKVTKNFFKDYQLEFVRFLDFIQGIDHDADRKWYASVILNRLMFIYFLQKKYFLDNGNEHYLSEKLVFSKANLGKDKYYSVFLKKLFFEGFAKDEANRDSETKRLIGNIKYLNGGLFLKHKIERTYPNIQIADEAFENLLSLFTKYAWSLDDTPSGKDGEINPDVLGYIFEKYINQKAFGAYYTRSEITEYLCEQTVYKLILDEVNEPGIDEEALKKLGLDKTYKPKNFQSIEALLIHLDAPICKKLVMGDTAILSNLSLLDPACGSGAFLVAAMKTLINVYAAILGKIDFLGDKKLTEWKKQIETEHPSKHYYIKKQIITHNLYGVDIMEEATEIAKLRLFLALVASAQTVDQLEPLPNIDFNIMSGNSLIGMMRVDANRFNQQTALGNVKSNKGKVVQNETLFQPGLVQGGLFSEDHAKSYQQLINEKEAAIRSYKDAHKLGITDLQSLRDSIQENEQKANEILHKLLLEEFITLGIKYEQATWDEAKNKEGKPNKRALNIQNIEALEPFHWGYEFSEIFRKKDGFDAIITNPPWEIFKPDAKEFFAEYSDLVTKKKMDIKDFEKEQEKLLESHDTRAVWLEYQSKFPHVSSYYRSATQYKNQISVVNGKKAGTDINLYKLFTEQCYNLLKKGGYCGIVIPSGIYTDLGTKQMRQLLFEQTKLTGLFCFENRKIIFENVDSRFKFVVLSFEKGGNTQSFPAAFMRHDVAELVSFPQYGASIISVDFVKRQSPDSLSVMELKNELEFQIAHKFEAFPMIGNEPQEGDWNIRLGNEFHMTNDSHLFQTVSNNNSLPLFEGKMIWQYNSFYSKPKYWIKSDIGRISILGRKKDEGNELDYQKYRVAFREIASSTNERGLIATILPKNVFANHKLMLSTSNSKGLTNEVKLLVVGFLNSFVFDFQIRQRTSTSISMHIFYQSPIPKLNSKNKWYKPIVEKAAKLICTTVEFAELWEEVMQTKWNDASGVTNEEERNKLRAELDGIVAHLYGLTEIEFQYILNTFPIVVLEQKQATLQVYKDLAPQFAASSQEEKQMDTIIQKGESNVLEFKSTLRVDVKTIKPEKYIEHSVLKTLAAFLNSEGGTLLIGVDDEKNVLGLDLDFNSFSKPDKLDEFQKHFDNLIAKSIGNRFQRYLQIEFPQVEGKIICSVTIKEKSSGPVHLINDANQEIFYIRRQASTVELKPSEASLYIKDHWK